MRWGMMLAGCVAVVGLAACGSSDGDGTLLQGRLTLRDGQSIAQAQECGGIQPPCPQGLSCVSFKLDGESRVACMNESVLCEEVLSCTGGTECVILESYPAQVTCSGTCTGPDCDSAVSSSP